MQAAYNRKQSQGLTSISQIPGESSMDENTNAKLVSRNKRKVKRFLQYIIPPILLCMVTAGIFVPSYKSDPRRKLND